MAHNNGWKKGESKLAKATVAAVSRMKKKVFWSTIFPSLLKIVLKTGQPLS